jgi:heat shock protein HslJ/uncharacterized membrane protein
LAALAAEGGCAREAGRAPPTEASDTTDRASNASPVTGILQCGERHATFVTGRAGDPALLELSMGARLLRLHQVPATSGKRYEAASHSGGSLWLEADSATLVLDGLELSECTRYGHDRPYGASGNEPSWELRIGSTLRFRAGSTRLDAPMVPPQSSTGEWHYVTAVQGRPLTVTVFERRCVDTMSGIPHPTSVEVTFDDEQYAGCGGDPVTLLRGAAWVVEIIDRVTAPARTTLSFGADGRVTGVGPCHHFDATYALTGEGLSVSRPATTLEACVPPRRAMERRFREVLEHAHHFELAGDGALILHATDGTTIAARRP